MIHRDEFEAWRKDPVTLWVMRAVTLAIDANKAEWVRQSWDAGKADPEQLLDLRSASDAMSEVRDNAYEDWCRWNGEPIEQD